MAHSEDAGGGQSAALRKLLMLSRLLTQQEDQARILQLVSEAAESLVACRTEGILLDQVWQDIGRQGGQISAADVQCSALPARGARVGCARYGSGSGRTMGSSIQCNDIEDVGKKGLVSAHVLMSDNQSNT